jgi:putative ABC transport system permease protein
MKKTFFKNLFRDIKKSFSRFLSIVIIIAIGVAFYAGVRAASPDMKMSADYYFSKNNFMDFKLISSFGLTKEDLTEVQKQSGVIQAEGSYSIDAVVEKNKRQLVMNINSLPDENGINNIRIIKGRRSENANEAIVEEKFLKENKLKLGDRILLKSGNEINIENSLKNSEFKIVGTAKSPIYISEQRQLSYLGNGTVRGFVYVLPEVFRSEVYTEIYVRTDNKFSKNSLLENENYKENIVVIEKNLKDIKPDWYVLGRSENVGYETYRQDSDRIDNIGKAFPLIFFLVASLVSLTTMTRMVQDKRIEIGSFKALGYSRVAIVAHYLIYALSASTIGSLIGILVGFNLFPPFIMNAYSSIYYIPELVTPFNTPLALHASLVAVFFTAIAAVASTLEELKEVPASLMRPKPPKSGKKIFLERVDFIWKRLNFTKKVTARNIFRYKQRLFMTVIGIAACTGLMITGFGLKEGVIGAAEIQFDEIYKYDMQGTLYKSVDKAYKNDIKTKVEKDSNVKSILFTYWKNGSVKLEDSKSQEVYVVVPEDKVDFNSYINLTMKGKELKLHDDGVILTKKLSKLVNKKVGDTIEITVNDRILEAKISAITEHYIQHYIYMSAFYYKKITGSNITFNSFYGLLNNKSEAMEKDTLNTLKDISSINSIVFKNNVQVEYNKSINTLNTVVILLIVSAGVLAFVVIYNLTNINIIERRRELATIKLLGFYNSELALYIYRENMILTVLGSLTGIFFGMFLSKFITSTAETNIIMFLQKISPIYFLYSILLTLLFSVVVNLAMYNRFDKIDMIESLKSAE